MINAKKKKKTVNYYYNLKKIIKLNIIGKINGQFLANY